MAHVVELWRSTFLIFERPSGPNPKDCTSPPADRWSAKDSSPRCEISHSRQRIKGPTLRASCTPDLPGSRHGEE